MQRWIVGGTLAAAVIPTGLGVGTAQAGSGQNDIPITGDGLAQASAAR